MKHSGQWQPRLFLEQPILYLPKSGSDGTGAGLGPPWVAGSGVTVSHPTPAAGMTTQFRRTRFTSVAVTADQELGVHLPNAADCSLYRGSATSRGGFFFSSRFMVNAIPNNAIRFFCGLSAANSGVCVSNTIPVNSVGLFCESGDSAALKLVARPASGSQVPTALTSAVTLTAGTLYEFRLWANPNQNVIVTQLINAGTDTVLNNQNLTAPADLPGNTVMLAPQCGLSNAANVVGGDCSLDILSIYGRPNLLLVPSASGL